MPGTCQGKSGWYEIVSKDGKSLVVKYQIDEQREWQIARQPMPKEIFLRSADCTPAGA
jgi:hypothetical protein